MATYILFPPGRMVGGNIDTLRQRTEADGKTPKIGRDGKPEMNCNIGYAIPKGAEKAWWETVWGAEIYKVGSAAHPSLVATPAFSWKIIDGDSAIPNKNGKKPCEQTGYPGHWVLWFSQGWLPERVNTDGTVKLPEGAIVPGYYVQVYGSVAGNKLVPNGTPGVYLNPLAVALVGEGDKIATDVDTTSVGFGNAPPPPGARPVTPAAPQFAGAPPVPGMPPVPGAAAPPPVPPAAPAPAPVAAPALPPGPPAGAPPVPGAVVPPAAPSQTFLAPPPVPPAAPALAPVAAAPVMLPAAQGVTYEAFKAQGWTDEQLRQQGMMQ